jgi:phosphoglycerate kinase
VRIAEDCNGQRVDGAAQSLAEGQVLLLENLRFHLEEEKNDPVFAQALAKLADIFVNDAFGVCHRSHASTVGVTKYLPSVAGFLLEKELDTLTRALDNPTRPFTALIGGKKVRDKMGVIENILDKVDSLLIAGGMVSTFLKLLKYNLDQTIVEEEAIGLAQKLVDKAGQKGVHLLLPIDVVVADRLDPEGKSKTVSIANIPSGWHIMDIGPRTIEVFVSKLRKSKTVIWNGPVGIFEFPKFQKGSRAIATTLASLDATTIVGGGSTAEVVQEMGLVHKLTHVSTGGGASLKLLEGQGLPGVASLMAKD